MGDMKPGTKKRPASTPGKDGDKKPRTGGKDAGKKDFKDGKKPFKKPFGQNKKPEQPIFANKDAFFRDPVPRRGSADPIFQPLWLLARPTESSLRPGG
mmetsp:Transcript_24935/g.78977  ORF Transcript_24935/g.78977 Transcript_24935/m.78977 type:complete len:98 (+) Transcript_24935:1517-1810(+)